MKKTVKQYNGLISKIEILKNEKNWRAAKDLLGLAIIQDENVPLNLYIEKLHCLNALYLYDEWENDAKLLIHKFNQRPEGYEWLAKLYQQKREFALALESWELAFKNNEKAPPSYFIGKIQCYLDTNDLISAEQISREFINQYAEIPQSYFWLSKTYQQKKKWIAALEQIELAFQLTLYPPQNFFMTKIYCQLQSQTIHEVQITMNEFVKMFADIPISYQWAAETCQKNLQFEKALFYWKTALNTLKKSPVNIYAGQIQCYIKLRRYDDAEVALQSLQENHREKQEFYQLSAQLAVVKGDFDKACIIWKTLFQRFPNNKNAFIQIGNVLITQERYQEAYTHFLQIDSCSSNDLEWSLLQQALGLEKLGLYQESITKIKQLIDINSNHIQANMILARSYKREGNLEQAKMIYSTLIKNHPQHQLAYFELSELQDDEISKQTLFNLKAVKPLSPPLLIREIHYYLKKNQVAKVKELIAQLEIMEISSETTDLLSLHVNTQKHWLSIYSREITKPNDFVLFNDFFMAVLRSEKDPEKVKILLDQSISTFENKNWFLHHYAEWLNRHDNPKQALIIWLGILEQEKQRKVFIGAMNAAAKLSDYKLLIDLCIQYADNYRLNSIVCTHYEKAKLAFNSFKSIKNDQALLVNSNGDRPFTVLHSGDLGDLIYAMPIMKRLGAVKVLLTTTFDTSQAMNGRLVLINDLFSSQSYIDSIGLWDGQVSIDYDLSSFRQNSKLFNSSITDSQANYLFGSNDLDINQSWLDVPITERHNRVVFARSARYRNPNWDDLWNVLKKMYPNAIFLGIESEYRDFSSGEFVPTKDLYEAAKIIAGAKLFVGNQSSLYAIAEGLKVNRMLEACHFAPNCSQFAQAVSLF